VEAGELDQQMDAASGSLRKGFQRWAGLGSRLNWVSSVSVAKNDAKNAVIYAEMGSKHCDLRGSFVAAHTAMTGIAAIVVAHAAASGEYFY